MSPPLSGARVLILEDEFLIAMDVEEMCRDAGADATVICRSIGEVEDRLAVARRFDVAILDMWLSGVSTMDFARSLYDQGVPFVFATGYSANDDFARDFPGVETVGKPYVAEDLIAAVARARHRSSGGA